MPNKVSSQLKCPKCKQGHLIERTIKSGDRGGQSFFGCNQYFGVGDNRNCDYTQRTAEPKLEYKMKPKKVYKPRAPSPFRKW